MAISFTAQKTGEVVIRLYDGMGRDVIKTTKSVDKSGQHTVDLDIHSISNGTYHYDIMQEHTVFTTGSFVVMKK